MSKFTDAITASHTLSIAAMEEASRLNARTADLDHLLLALTLDSGPAGQVLRSLGLTIAAVRDAVDAEHHEQVASLGIQVDAPEPGRIRFHETGGYEWSERGLAVIRKAGEGGRRGDAPAILRSLVQEPSGSIEALLRRLDTTPAQVVRALDEAERHPGPRGGELDRRASISGTSEAFVPAEPGDVWALLSDPARTPDWDPAIGAIIDAPAAPSSGDSWGATARTHRPDGKELRVRPGFERLRVELIASDPEHSIEWRHSYPESPGANSRRIRIEIEPAAGGAQLRTFLAWERAENRRPRPFLGLIMQPLARFAVRMQLAQIGGSIGRVFR